MWTSTVRVAPSAARGPTLPSASICSTRTTSFIWPLRTQTVATTSLRSSSWTAWGESVWPFFCCNVRSGQSYCRGNQVRSGQCYCRGKRTSLCLLLRCRTQGRLLGNLLAWLSVSPSVASTLPLSADSHLRHSNSFIVETSQCPVTSGQFYSLFVSTRTKIIPNIQY